MEIDRINIGIEKDIQVHMTICTTKRTGLFVILHLHHVLVNVLRITRPRRYRKGASPTSNPFST